MNHASSAIFIQNQKSLGVAETLTSTKAFERFAAEYGVKIKSYLSDNGVFKSQYFKDHCQKHDQTQEFSGVGAHHQNGVAERNIKTVVRWARTMMIHAALHWPATTKDLLELWPFAMNHAVFLWNNMPAKGSGLAPLEVFADATNDVTFLRSMHVLGLPNICA